MHMLLNSHVCHSVFIWFSCTLYPLSIILSNCISDINDVHYLSGIDWDHWAEIAKPSHHTALDGGLLCGAPEETWVHVWYMTPEDLASHLSTNYRKCRLNEVLCKMTFPSSTFVMDSGARRKSECSDIHRCMEGWITDHTQVEVAFKPQLNITLYSCLWFHYN